MTNDIFPKGFWPPEAKAAVDLGSRNYLKYAGASFIIFNGKK